MATVIFEENGCISLGSIENESDLLPRRGININPPPQDGRCDCCGRHIKELKPFGKAGDPLVQDFDGEYLVMRERPDAPHDEEAESAMKEALACYKDQGSKSPVDWMARRYGEKKGEDLCFRAQISGRIGSSWECRDCIDLDDAEYFARLRHRRKQEVEDSRRN